MHETFHMSIEDVFLLREGHTVFAGPIEEGEMAIIEPGPATILVNGQKLATVRIDREAIPLRALPCKELRSERCLPETLRALREQWWKPTTANWRAPCAIKDTDISPSSIRRRRIILRTIYRSARAFLMAGTVMRG